MSAKEEGKYLKLNHGEFRLDTKKIHDYGNENSGMLFQLGFRNDVLM